MASLKLWMQRGAMAAMVAMAIGAVAPHTAFAAKPPQEWDGLARKSSKKLDNVYVLPMAQFTAYKSVRLLPIEVAFDKSWDPNSSSVHRLSNADIEKIRVEIAKLFHDEFAARLGKGGYSLVETDGDDVLRVEAALINIYINAPDTMTAGRSRSYTTDAGRVTLVMELRDSVTHQLLARVVDTKQGSSTGRMQWTNTVTNSAEARRAFDSWADALRKALDEVNGKVK